MRLLDGDDSQLCRIRIIYGTDSKPAVLLWYFISHFLVVVEGRQSNYQNFHISTPETKILLNLFCLIRFCWSLFYWVYSENYIKKNLSAKKHLWPDEWTYSGFVFAIQKPLKKYLIKTARKSFVKCLKNNCFSRFVI